MEGVENRKEQLLQRQGNNEEEVDENTMNSNSSKINFLKEKAHRIDLET